MRVLLAAAEIYPFAKTGGLADVCAALPKALSALGADVRLLLPAYESALDSVRVTRVLADLDTVLGVAPVRLLQGIGDSGRTVWLLDCPPLYRRPGTPYQDANGVDWSDNALRFGVFCHAIARIALGSPDLGWRPDVVHCHDWHTGLVPYLLTHARGKRPHTVFTIHNAAFHGCFPAAAAARLGLPDAVMHPEAMEFYGRMSFLKAGIRYADRLTTVSPSYARELLTPEFGCGLEGLIATRADSFVGILNGIDTDLWNPQTDTFIAQRYNAETLQGKAACKARLQKDTGLAVDTGALIVASASRLTAQKMANITLERLPALLERHPRLQLALLGTGEAPIEAGFRALAQRFPERAAIRIGYSEAEEHRLHAGSDVLLHGARFEPCGLTQMCAMRYGALPIVRRVGGLADSVRDGQNGFVFDAPDGSAMQAAVQRALEVHATGQGAWQSMQQRAMNGAFSWEKPAREYLQVYRDGHLAGR